MLWYNVCEHLLFRGQTGEESGGDVLAGDQAFPAEASHKPGNPSALPRCGHVRSSASEGTHNSLSFDFSVFLCVCLHCRGCLRVCAAASVPGGRERAGGGSAVDRADDVWEELAAPAAAPHTPALQLQHLEPRRFPTAHRSVCACVCVCAWKIYSCCIYVYLNKQTVLFMHAFVTQTDCHYFCWMFEWFLIVESNSWVVEVKISFIFYIAKLYLFI